MNKKRNRVFISYNQNDRDIALRISNELERENIDVFFDYKDISNGDNVFDQIRYMYESSETVIVLLSNSLFSSRYFQQEFPQYFFEEARKRKINVIPVLVEKCQIPSDFLEFDIINFSNDFEKGLRKVIQKLRIIPEINFENFSPIKFEDFTYDFLREYNFKNIQREKRFNNQAIDFLAETFTKDAFGIPKKETWIIEAKFYQEERFSVRLLNQIVQLYNYVDRDDARILLITNSLFTSAAEEYIQNAKTNQNLQIRIIDGTLLKKLVSKRKRLINKYFSL